MSRIPSLLTGGRKGGGASAVADSRLEGFTANGEQAALAAVDSTTEAQAGTPDLAAAAQAAAAFQTK
jgi:hypothetical protein